IRAKMLEQFVRQLFEGDNPKSAAVGSGESDKHSRNIKVRPGRVLGFPGNRGLQQGDRVARSILLGVYFIVLLIAVSEFILTLSAVWLAMVVGSFALCARLVYVLREPLFLASDGTPVPELMSKFYKQTAVAGLSKNGERPAYIGDQDF